MDLQANKSVNWIYKKSKGFPGFNVQYIFRIQAFWSLFASLLLCFFAPSDIQTNLFKEILGFIAPMIATVFATYSALYFAALAIMVTSNTVYMDILKEIEPTRTLGAFYAIVLCIAVAVTAFLLITLFWSNPGDTIGKGAIIPVFFFFFYSTSVSYSIIKQIIEVTFKHIKLEKIFQSTASNNQK